MLSILINCAFLIQGIGQVAVLRTGHSFGELALTEGDDHRGATVQASTQMELLQLHKVDYDHFVKDIQLAERRENFHILKNCVLFNNWTKSKIQKMCNACVRKIFAPGEYVFQQGDPCDSIYFVVDGKIDVYKEVVVVVRNRWPCATAMGEQEGISRKKKKPFLVHTLKKEDYFGEQAITQDQLRTVSCVASTLSTVLLLDRLEFAHYIENDVAIQVMKNAHNDYVLDKQILNTMIMSCKIRGGPSTTAQLNKCLEIVNEYEPSKSSRIPIEKTHESIGRLTNGGRGEQGRRGKASGRGARPSGESKSSDHAADRRVTQRKKSMLESIMTADGTSNPRPYTADRAIDNGSGTTDETTKLKGFLPPTNKIRNTIHGATTIPYESFFVQGANSRQSTENKDNNKAGIMAEEEADDNDHFLHPEFSHQPRHLNVMKSELLELMRSKKAPKMFCRQLSKMPNCADNLRIHRYRPKPLGSADDSTAGGGEEGSSEMKTDVYINDKEESSSLSKKIEDSKTNNLKRKDSMMSVLTGEVIESKR